MCVTAEQLKFLAQQLPNRNEFLRQLVEERMREQGWRDLVRDLAKTRKEDMEDV